MLCRGKNLLRSAWGQLLTSQGPIGCRHPIEALTCVKYPHLVAAPSLARKEARCHGDGLLPLLLCSEYGLDQRRKSRAHVSRLSLSEGADRFRAVSFCRVGASHPAKGA